MTEIEQGEGCSCGPAGRPIDSDPARVSASTAALSPAGDAGHLTVDVSQPGILLSQAELQLAYHMLRSFPDRRHSVGALVEQIGLQGFSGVVEGVVHDPEIAREDFRDVGKLTQEFGKITRICGGSYADR